MANLFVHSELSTDDVDKAKSFYSALFDWTLQDIPMPQGAYTMINSGVTSIGGLTRNMAPGTPSHWMPYVSVDDIHKSTAKAKELGANVVLDSQEVMGAGWLSVFIDPTGAMLGLWQATKAA
jgi:uncharacterized protein